jgi:hypothetical protein
MLPGGAVPADDRVRLDEDQGGTPGGPVAGDPGPEEAIGGPEPVSTGRTGENEKLVAEGEVLQHEFTPDA